MDNTLEQPPLAPRSEGSTPGHPRFDVFDSGRLRRIVRRVLGRYLDWNRTLLLDPWLRYRPVVSILVGHSSQNLNRILDVGSGTVGLAHFLRRPVVGVDVSFSSTMRPHHATPLQPICGSASSLPFRDGSFDAVVSMDMIEHLPKGARPAAVRELVRVARTLVVVGFPFGADSARFDREALAEERARGIVLDWRHEHVMRSHPDSEVHRMILQTVKERSPQAEVRWFGHEGLLGLRLRWKLQFFVNKDSFLYGVVFAPLYALHARGRRRIAYRRVYVARFSDRRERLGVP